MSGRWCYHQPDGPANQQKRCAPRGACLGVGLFPTSCAGSWVRRELSGARRDVRGTVDVALRVRPRHPPHACLAPLLSERCRRPPHVAPAPPPADTELTPGPSSRPRSNKANLRRQSEPTRRTLLTRQLPTRHTRQLPIYFPGPRTGRAFLRKRLNTSETSI